MHENITSSSLVINPNPFVSSNHFTVPLAIAPAPSVNVLFIRIIMKPDKKRPENDLFMAYLSKKMHNTEKTSAYID
jgi:hypothetical protein